MEEFLKPLLSGAGFAGGLLVYFFWKIEPRLGSMERAMLLSSKVELLRIAAMTSIHPQLKDAAQSMLNEVNESLTKNQ